MTWGDRYDARGALVGLLQAERQPAPVRLVGWV
jgi:hypothetical protein